MIDLGDCTLCGHPRRDHKDFELCHCGCVRPTLVLSAEAIRSAEQSMPEEDFGEWLRAMHTLAEDSLKALDEILPVVDSSWYAPVEEQQTKDGRRLVRLCDEPMPVGEVLPWLIEQGLVKRVEVVCQEDDEHCDGYVHVGWGTTYFAAPFDKTVAR